jgi:riboflavin biosynthesis pyrimidine reductase
MKDLTEGRETWVATANTNMPGRIRTLERQGARILQCPTDHDGRVDLAHLLGELAQAGVSCVLVEGGGKILTSFVKMGAFQRLVCFIAPIILGQGVDALEDLGISRVDEALRFATWKVMKSGEDVVVDALLDPSSCVYMSSNRRQ